MLEAGADGATDGAGAFVASGGVATDDSGPVWVVTAAASFPVAIVDSVVSCVDPSVGPVLASGLLEALDPQAASAMRKGRSSRFMRDESSSPVRRFPA
ncbi:MAG: hypothetical protein B7C54_09650 [Acidimicrobiales bacterium mtb01]|nr:MAG: hypothetical protein B7C54_09650 [Acidimicrobiales bacterium mtb01]